MLEEKYKNLLTKRWQIYEDIFGLDNFGRRIEKRLDRVGGKKSLAELTSLLPIAGKKLLDVGSCCGEFLFEAVAAGAVGYGAEPNELSLEVSRLLFQINEKKAELIRASAEKLPFSENSFDIAVSIFILEHIRDIEPAIQEMMRVLKPGGSLWLRCPNYLYPREHHYKRYYFPFLPKTLEQIYFNLVSRRHSDYFKRLNRITPGKIFKILKKNNWQYRDLATEKARQGGLAERLLRQIHIYPEINLLIQK